VLQLSPLTRYARPRATGAATRSAQRPFKGYVIFFRYLDDNVFEVVRIIEGHRDIPALFADDDGK